MKKILSLVAGATMVLSAQAYTRILFQQTFEGMTDPTQEGWTKADDNSGLEINSDEEGSFLKVYTKGNDRASWLYWGDAIYTDKNGESYIEDGKYTVSFDFNYQVAANNHYNTEMTIFTGEYDIKSSQASWSFWNQTRDWVLDLTQISDADLNATMPQLIANNDSTTKAGVSLDNWYTAEVVVDIENRTADYIVYPIVGSETPFQGSYTVPDTAEIMATGLNVLAARYTTALLIDNVTVSCESDKAVANPPVVALSRIGTEMDGEGEYSIVNLNLRAYTITFPEDHTLHVKATNGNEETIEWADCEGSYSYETTTSGTLEAWTTLEDATSDYVTIDVDCTPCKLPKAEATISNVQVGYAKEYTLSANNSEVPLMPTIYLAYEFTAKDGTKLSDKNLSSGAKVSLPGEGELVVTTSALGYAENTMSIENNIEYAQKANYDFARMTEDEILAMGFAKIDDLRSDATSGENNWTARKRLFYYDSATEVVDEATGEKSYTAVYPFGYDAANENACIHRYQIAEEALAEGKDSTIIPGVTFWSTKSPLQWMQNLGMMATTTTANNQPVKFSNIRITDFLVVNTIDNYGGDSNHPIVANADEYYAKLEGTNYVFSGREAVPAGETADINTMYTYTYNLYRIQTVMTKATVFEIADLEGIGSVAVENDNNDPYYYTIDGLRLLEPTHAGLYIHNGKKVYITK